MDYPWPGSRFPPQDPTPWTLLPFSAPEYPAILSIPADSQQWIPTAYEQGEHVTTSAVHVVPHQSGFLNGQMAPTLPPSPYANDTVAQSHQLQLSDNTNATESAKAKGTDIMSGGLGASQSPHCRTAHHSEYAPSPGEADRRGRVQVHWLHCNVSPLLSVPHYFD
jgi:hypothetical protein